jgi:hypothetical protein
MFPPLHGLCVLELARILARPGPAGPIDSVADVFADLAWER